MSDEVRSAYPIGISPGVVKQFVSCTKLLNKAGMDIKIPHTLGDRTEIRLAFPKIVQYSNQFGAMEEVMPGDTMDRKVTYISLAELERFGITV